MLHESFVQYAGQGRGVSCQDGVEKCRDDAKRNTVFLIEGQSRALCRTQPDEAYCASPVRSFITETQTLKARENSNSDQAVSNGIGCQFSYIAKVELAHEIGTMLFHGFDAEREMRGYFPVFVALGNELHDFPLAHGEPAPGHR